MARGSPTIAALSQGDLDKLNPIRLAPIRTELAIKIKRGGEVIEMAVAEILVERLIQAMTTGSPRDMALIVAMLERYAPDVLASTPEQLEVTYHRAEGSNVPLPPADLWKRTKP